MTDHFLRGVFVALLLTVGLYLALAAACYLTLTAAAAVLR